jgi:hypothetical protein
MSEGQHAVIAASHSTARGEKGRRDVGWVIIHWFELGTLTLLCLNLWFVSSVLHALRDTNRWLAFLTRIRWDETDTPEGPNAGGAVPP